MNDSLSQTTDGKLVKTDRLDSCFVISISLHFQISFARGTVEVQPIVGDLAILR